MRRSIWLWAGLLGLGLLVACGDRDLTIGMGAAGTGNAGADAGASAGSGGVGGSGGASGCPWPANGTQGASTGWAQQWCDGTAKNPADCPATQPAAGTSCSVQGTRCGYGSGNNSLLSLCDGTWKQSSILCKTTCTAPDAGVPVVDLSKVACGSRGNVGCVGSANWTNAVLLNNSIFAISPCCGKAPEASVTVMFKDGCATALYGNKYLPQSMLDCYAATLSGRRLACATKQICGGTGWSTLP